MTAVSGAAISSMRAAWRRSVPLLRFKCHVPQGLTPVCLLRIVDQGVGKAWEGIT